MPVMQLLRRVQPHSISRYALGFFLVLTAALATLAVLVLHDVARLNDQVARSDELLAKQELSQAIGLLSRHAEEVAQSLTQWDEARAQLQDPTYYGYWRNSRALAAGVLPAAIDAVDLYDGTGRNLSPVTADESFMPAQIQPADTRPTLVHERGHDHMYFFFPMFQDAERTRLAGYAGIKFDFLVKLYDLRKFRYLDLNSVRVDAREGTRLHLDEIVPHLRFATLPNPEIRVLEKIVQASFFKFALVVVTASLLGYLALLAVVAKPLRRLSSHIEGMRGGHAGLLDESYRGPLALTELENVRQSLNDYQQQLDNMHLSLAHKNEELWVMAHHDPLTGMFNRRAFDDDWRSLRQTQGAAQTQVAFLLFDCDHFKAINDTYGHQTGDQVIQGLAESLHGALRNGDRLYRLGGDEFATILFATDSERARHVAERCVEQVNRHDFSAYGVKEPVRISVGVAHAATAEDGTLRLLHRQADVAMYHAKRPGQTKIAVYSADMGEGNAALVSNAETSAVYHAMAEPDRLEMHYQPVVALPAAKVEYYEALVRIRDGATLIPPSSIFPVVELRGLELEFDLAVLEKVWRDLSQGRIPAGSGVSLNVSGPGIVNARIIDKLMQFAPLLAEYKLVLEVTETSLITQIAQASSHLNQLRKVGFVIALDDFGSGYSSLRYLSSMPVDLVKFDISMVRSLEDRGRQAIFVEDLARMIKDAGYALVAEGIESEALLQRVSELGFSHAQGFHIGRPAPLPLVSTAAESLPAAT